MNNVQFGFFGIAELPIKKDEAQIEQIHDAMAQFANDIARIRNTREIVVTTPRSMQNSMMEQIGEKVMEFMQRTLLLLISRGEKQEDGSVVLPRELVNSVEDVNLIADLLDKHNEYIRNFAEVFDAILMLLGMLDRYAEKLQSNQSATPNDMIN